MMIRHALFAAATLLTPTCALAGGIPQPGDIYFISRDQFGTFVGSHQLFLKYSKGLKPVQYCNRDYFVRSHSVAWTQYEARNGRTVRIEFNFGKGWRPICDRPQDQVTLLDLGITMQPDEYLLQSEKEDKPVSRLSAISGVFNKSKSDSRYKSYHIQ